MDFLDQFFKRKKAPKKDFVQPIPNKGAARFFFLLTTHTTKLFYVNLLFLFFCLPVITIPAALSGMSRVCMLLVRDGTSFVWTDFITEFKTSFIKSMVVFLSSIVFLPSAYLCTYISRSVETGAGSFLLFVLAVLIFFWSLLMICYAFAMMSLCKLRTGEIIRNAISLIFLEPKADIFLILLVGGITIACMWLLPYSIPLVLILFALLSLISGVIVYEPIKRRIIAVC